MIRFPCGTCGKRLRVPARLAGKRGRCERCGAVNRVPMEDVPPEAAVAATPARTAAATAPPTPVPTPPPPSPPPRPSAPEPPLEGAAVEEWTDRSPNPSAGNGAAPPVPAPSVAEPAPAPSPPAEAAAIPEINFVDEVPSPDDAANAPAEDLDSVGPPPAIRDEVDDRGPPPKAPASPRVLAVDVRRAEGPSPFRSTADVTARETIETTVNLPDAQFAADGRPIAVVEGADANRTVENFLEVVSRRIGVVGRPESLPSRAADDDEEPPPMRILHVDVDVIEDDDPLAVAPAVSPAWRPPHAAPIAPPQRLERGPVVVALLVGLILGFCAGLLASEWL